MTRSYFRGKKNIEIWFLRKTHFLKFSMLERRVLVRLRQTFREEKKSYVEICLPACLLTIKIEFSENEQEGLSWVRDFVFEVYSAEHDIVRMTLNIHRIFEEDMLLILSEKLVTRRGRRPHIKRENQAVTHTGTVAFSCCSFRRRLKDTEFLSVVPHDGKWISELFDPCSLKDDCTVRFNKD